MNTTIGALVMAGVLLCPLPCTSQTLLDGQDICAEHVVSILENFGAGQAEIARIRATVSGDFIGGEAKVAAGEFIYQPGEMLVAIYPHGETFVDGVYATTLFLSDGAVDRELILVDADGAQDYSSIMATWVTIETLLFDTLGDGLVTRNSCMEQARVELFIEENVPAERSTMSSIKAIYR